MPNEPLSTQNYVQIGDKVLNRTADASITTNDVSLSDRIFVFKKNEDGSIKTVVNTTIQYIVDAFSADATAIKNSTKEYCDGIKADTSQLKADTEALKNAAVTAKTSAESARDSAISAKNSASTSATNASNSASSASASATSASNSATTASTKASEASNSANQAKGYKTQAFRDEINPSLLATKTEVQNAVNEVMKALYPVGSIYLSLVKQDPGTWIAGTRWSLIDSGYALWTTTANDAGSPIPAGLPNIKGSFVISTAIEGTTNPPNKDAFSRYLPSQIYGEGFPRAGEYWNNEGLGTIAWGFDAGKYNSIYKDSNDTVQPPAMKIYAYRRETDS